jgi:hypothetical protein
MYYEDGLHLNKKGTLRITQYLNKNLAGALSTANPAN